MRKEGCEGGLTDEAEGPFKIIRTENQSCQHFPYFLPDQHNSLALLKALTKFRVFMF